LFQLRGDCHARLDDRDRADKDYARYLELEPDAARAANHVAWSYAAGPAAVRDPARALQLARRAVERAPDQWTYLNTLGVTLYRLGEYPEAVRHLSESLENNGREAAAWDLYFLAMCHHHLGDPAR